MSAKLIKQINKDIKIIYMLIKDVHKKALQLEEENTENNK